MDKTLLRDLPTGHSGNAYITVNGTRQDAFKLAKISPKFEFTVEEKQLLGDVMSQHAIRGGKGTGDLSYYQTTDVFIKAARTFKNTGSFPEITIQYYTDSDEYGRTEVVLYHVIPASIMLGMIDDSSTDAQKHDSSFTYDDFDII